MDENHDQFKSPSGMPPVVGRNIKAWLARRQAEQAGRTWSTKLADSVTDFAGNLPFVWIHLLLFGGWISWNLGWMVPRSFDPSLVVLAMAASVEAIFLSTFVLISQNCTAELAGKWADLDLRVILLATPDYSVQNNLTYHTYDKQAPVQY